MYNMCCGSQLKSVNKCPCIYKEYPILDLQQIYKKAKIELQKMETMGAIDMSEINKSRMEEEP